ncbi:uncharacterized protein [Ambystoma mexicanum]|uniref:uncharacterized protein n=1 Tax=Ambystoma mexicanum TaxID=8296 RepID=UPI0037E7BA98
MAPTAAREKEVALNPSEDSSWITRSSPETPGNSYHTDVKRSPSGNREVPPASSSWDYNNRGAPCRFLVAKRNSMTSETAPRTSICSGMNGATFGTQYADLLDFSGNTGPFDACTGNNGSIIPPGNPFNLPLASDIPCLSRVGHGNAITSNISPGVKLQSNNSAGNYGHSDLQTKNDGSTCLYPGSAFTFDTATGIPCISRVVAPKVIPLDSERLIMSAGQMRPCNNFAGNACCSNSGRYCNIPNEATVHSNISTDVANHFLLCPSTSYPYNDSSLNTGVSRLPLEHTCYPSNISAKSCHCTGSSGNSDPSKACFANVFPYCVFPVPSANFCKGNFETTCPSNIVS